MPNKAYAIMLKQDSHDENYAYFYFPIPHGGGALDGMPAFFGGTKEAGESDLETIRRETLEESDDTINVLELGPRVHTKLTPDGSRYNFYVVSAYTGQLRVARLHNDEMDRIENFPVSYGGEHSLSDLLGEVDVGPLTATYQNTETYKAFNKAITWSERC